MKKSFGMLIRKLRTERKDTLMGLADKVDIDYSSLSKIERGERDASVELVKKIIDLYSVDPKYFFGEGFTDSEGQLLLEDKLEPSDLIDKYDFVVDGVPATEEEIKDAIRLIRQFRGN